MWDFNNKVRKFVIFVKNYFDDDYNGSLGDFDDFLFKVVAYVVLYMGYYWFYCIYLGLHLYLKLLFLIINLTIT